MQYPRLLCAGILLSVTVAGHSDEVINDDLVVTGSTCVGIPCVDGENFGFDTLKLKSDRPGILFEDTSSSGSFPSNDWRVGISDDAAAVPASFFIRDVTNGITALLITPAGDVALGAGSAPEAGTVSIGSPGNERRVSHVADAVQDTDAVNLRQFQAFQETAATEIQTEAGEFDDRLGKLENRIDNLSDRVEAISDWLNTSGRY